MNSEVTSPEKVGLSYECMNECFSGREGEDGCKMGNHTLQLVFIEYNTAIIVYRMLSKLSIAIGGQLGLTIQVLYRGLGINDPEK